MWLVLSLAAFLTSVTVHAVTVRLIERAGSVAVFIAIGTVVGLALIGYCARRFGLEASILAAALTYAFLCELYIFLFTLAGNSVSFGLLTKLAKHPLKPAEIARFYRAEAMISRRLEQLERGSLITAGPAGFSLTARGEVIVRFFSLLHAIFRRPNQWVSGTSCGGDDAS